MSQPRGCPSEAQQREPDVFHISSCGSHLLTRKRSVGEPNAQVVGTCSGKTDHTVVRKMSNGLHEVCQATRQSLFQRVEKAAAEEDTYTAPFHFLVDSTSSFRQLFVNEVWTCSTSSATTWKHPVGMTDLQVLNNKKKEMPCWTKGHVPNSCSSSQLVLRSQMLSSLSPIRRRWRSNAGDRSFASTVAGPCAGESRCCSDSLRRTVGS